MRSLTGLMNAVSRNLHHILFVACVIRLYLFAVPCISVPFFIFLIIIKLCFCLVSSIISSFLRSFSVCIFVYFLEYFFVSIQPPSICVLHI